MLQRLISCRIIIIILLFPVDLAVIDIIYAMLNMLMMMMMQVCYTVVATGG